MKHTTILLSILAIAACGGGKKAAPEEPKETAPAAAEPAPPPAPPPAPEPPPPPPPKQWKATAELTPLKGQKIKGATVTFAQTEGKPVTVGSTGWFTGLKSGKYHLVVHEASACDPAAAKVGKALASPAGDMQLTVAAGMDAVDVGDVEGVSLDGDATIVGHTLVLHADAKGKPGKALACGAIGIVNE
jgi:Cu/Zn superoxide dismutase